MIYFLVSLLSISQPATGTGSSITGYISDNNGSPITGAVVSIAGEDIYDITDDTGWYHIDLESGSYAVLASIPGMGDEIAEAIELSEGESFRLDFQLENERAYELLQAGGYDSSIPPRFSSLNSDSIKSMPVSGIIDIVERQLGIVNNGPRCGSIKFFPAGTLNAYYNEYSALNAGNENNLHMRGGRRGEVVYIVDGVIHRNPIDRGFISNFPISSIQEISTVRGTFNAQFGNALSGIVEVETLEGGDSYHGGISISGNDWQALGLADDWTWGGTSVDDPVAWELSNVSSFSEARLEFGARIGGPEPITNILLPEIGIRIPGDMKLFIDGEFLETGGGEDERYGYGFDEWETSYRGIIKLTYNPVPSTKINLSTSFLNRKSGWFGVGDYWAWSRYEELYIDLDIMSPTYGDTLALGRNILYGLPTRFWNNRSINMNIDHSIGDETSFQVGLSQYRTSFDFKIRNDPESTDPMRQTEWLGEDWSWNDWQQYEMDLYTDWDDFIRSGTSRFPWNESWSTTTTLKADLTTGIGREQTLGLGIEGSFYDIFSYDIIADSNSVHRNKYSASPNAGSIYLQDRIEQDDGFALNAGIRIDYFDADYEQSSGPMNIPPPASFQRNVLNEIEAPVKYSLNPRIFIYSPVTERLAMHLDCGIYSQIPAFSQMYRKADYSFSEETPLGGNPDLDFERTILYEIGLTQKISEECVIDITGYVKSISDMVETELFSLSPIGTYALYTNSGYGESRGLEITLNAHPEGFFSWNLSYSLSKSTGTSSHALQNYLYSLYGLSNQDNDHYLDWDQRHTVHVDLDLCVPRGRGFRIAGEPVLQGLGVHLSWSFGSGFPFTYPDQGTYEPQINEGRYPATNTASLKINKPVWFSNMTLDAWCEVTNLFNRQNVDNIEDIEWYLPDDVDWSYGQGDPTGPQDNHYAFSQPRMVRFGLGLSW